MIDRLAQSCRVHNSNGEMYWENAFSEDSIEMGFSESNPGKVSHSHILIPYVLKNLGFHIVVQI